MMNVWNQQTIWPCFPVTLPNGEPGFWPVNVFGDESWWTMTPLLPSCSPPEESRAVNLLRSLFDLVEAHPALSCNDPKLLNWYLSLAPEDKKLVKDDGGIYHFLQRHPALELCTNHVYVNYSGGYTSPVQPSSRCQLPAVRTKYTQNELERPIQRSQENVVLYGCHSSRNGTQTQEEVEATAPLQDHGFVTEEPRYQQQLQEMTQLRENPPIYRTDGVCVNPSVLDGCRQPEPNRHMSRAADCDALHTDMSPFQAEWSTDEHHQSRYCSWNNTQMITAESEDLGSNLSEMSVGGSSGPKNCSDVGWSFVACDTENTVDYICEADLQTITEQGEGIISPPREGQRTSPRGIRTGSVTTERETLSVGINTLVKTSSAEKYPSSTTVSTRDVAVNTEPTELVSAFTQSNEPATADKHINTVIHMSDLDSLSQEFIKLKKAKQLSDQKEEQRSSQVPLDYLMAVLQKLERDYKQMRDKILAGVPLAQLKPLSVHSEEILTGACDVAITGETGERSVHQIQQPDPPGEGHGCTDDQKNEAFHDDRRKKTPTNSSRTRSVVTLVPKERCAHVLEGTSSCKELSTSEAWFDAKEYLEPAETTTQSKESGKEETTSLLSVSNLPSNVTEDEVKQWFEKYQALEVGVSSLDNAVRVAIVMVSSLHAAEGAATSLNGCVVRGHALRVELINSAPAGSQNEASPATPHTCETQSSAADGGAKPLHDLSMKNRKSVCFTPTANGTCVPQHYGTMSGFNTLIAQLTQLHSDVGRQQIVEALMELKGKHQDLCSLPLSTVRQMTSDLLTKHADVSQC